jgi:anti-sigma factor RsiW
MRGDGLNREPPIGASDAALWRRTCAIDAVEDEAESLLDLAGFADEQLDPDEQERVAACLQRDPDAAADVAAARQLATLSEPFEIVPEAVIARAARLLEPELGAVIPFPSRDRTRFGLDGMARWGSLAAAVAVASWLGFTLGMDTSRSLAPLSSTVGERSLQDMLDPSGSLMADLTESTQT